MSEETRRSMSFPDLVQPPQTPYACPIPDSGSVYNYRFLKEVGFDTKLVYNSS